MRQQTDDFAAGYLLGQKKGKAKTMTKTITENGTYNAEDEPVEEGEKKYDGYSSVTVEVPSYEEEYEALKQCQEEVIGLIAEITGITAQDCDDIQDLIKEMSKPPSPEDDDDIGEKPTDEEVEEAEDPESEITPEEIREKEEEKSPKDDEDEPIAPPSHDSRNPTIIPTGENEPHPEIPHKRYFAIKGLGWYAISFKKNNIFEGNDGIMWPKTNGWYVYWDTTVDVMITKVHEGVETIVTTGQIHTHSYGNPNYPYDPDYSGDDTRPGKTLGWKGHSSWGTPTPYISYYIDNQSRLVRVQTKTWWISGSGATSENTNTYDFSLV